MGGAYRGEQRSDHERNEGVCVYNLVFALKEFYEFCLFCSWLKSLN